MLTSSNVLLWQVRRSESDPALVPHLVGIADFAWRKGHHHDTILMDLERHALIDLLAAPADVQGYRAVSSIRSMILATKSATVGPVPASQCQRHRNQHQISRFLRHTSNVSSGSLLGILNRMAAWAPYESRTRHDVGSKQEVGPRLMQAQ